MAKKYKKPEIKFEAVLESYGALAVEGIKKQMEAMADKIKADMLSRVPVRTGKLKQSIRWHWSSDHEHIVFIADAANPRDNVKYGRLVEFDPRINKPFMYNSMDDHADEWHDRVVAALQKAARESAKKGGD